MPIVPIREVGAIGVISDISPYDLPSTVFSSARNVRFKNKKVTRSSVFKALATAHTFATAAPLGVIDASENGSDGCIVVPLSDGVLYQIYNGVITLPSPTVAWPATNYQVTSTMLGEVTYLSSEDGNPLYRLAPSAGLFQYIPGWTATDKCVALRSFKDFLIALNVTKAGVKYRNMVKWSNAAQNGAPPADWDVTDPASLAGENILNDANGELLDGVPMGPSFMLYGSEETYRMDYIGDPFIFTTSKLFSDLGVMAKNCVVDIDTKHYVFGKNNIFLHDGMQKVSISSSKVRNRIYKNLDYSMKHKCNVWHNKNNSEIVFAYVSTASEAQWSKDNTLGCNEAAVFNYVDQTWSFIDLPGVVGAVETSIPVSETWATLGNWDTLSGTWGSMEGLSPRATVVVSATNGVVPNQIYFMDDYEVGYLANPVVSSILWPAYAEAIYKDVDEAGVTLSDRVLVSKIMPQIQTSTANAIVNFSVGQSTNAMSAISWSASKPFNATVDYKINYRVNGRYIALRMDIPNDVYAEWSGYDIELSKIAGR